MVFAGQLTAEQKAFCRLMVEGRRQTEAYMEVFGVKKQSAAGSASRLVRRPEIVDYMDTLKNRIEDCLAQSCVESEVVTDLCTVITATEVLGVLSSIAKGEPQFVTNPNTGEDGFFRPRIADRLKAAESLAKHYGLLSEHIEMDNTIQVVMEREIEELSK